MKKKGEGNSIIWPREVIFLNVKDVDCIGNKVQENAVCQVE